MTRTVGIAGFFVIVILAISSWLNKIYPVVHVEDPMPFKLKYVRLRAIHEEEWLRRESHMTSEERDSLQRSVRQMLTLVQK